MWGGGGGSKSTENPTKYQKVGVVTPLSTRRGEGGVVTPLSTRCGVSKSTKYQMWGGSKSTENPTKYQKVG